MLVESVGTSSCGGLYFLVFLLCIFTHISLFVNTSEMHIEIKQLGFGVNVSKSVGIR